MLSVQRRIIDQEPHDIMPDRGALFGLEVNSADAGFVDQHISQAVITMTAGVARRLPGEDGSGSFNTDGKPQIQAWVRHLELALPDQGPLGTQMIQNQSRLVGALVVVRSGPVEFTQPPPASRKHVTTVLAAFGLFQQMGGGLSGQPLHKSNAMFGQKRQQFGNTQAKSIADKMKPRGFLRRE